MTTFLMTIHTLFFILGSLLVLVFAGILWLMIFGDESKKEAQYYRARYYDERDKSLAQEKALKEKLGEIKERVANMKNSINLLKTTR